MSARWYVQRDPKPEGPYTREQLQGRVHAGKLSRVDIVGVEGGQDWRLAGDVPELQPLFSAPPPKPQRKKGRLKPLLLIVVCGVVLGLGLVWFMTPSVEVQCSIDRAGTGGCWFHNVGSTTGEVCGRVMVESATGRQLKSMPVCSQELGAGEKRQIPFSVSGFAQECVLYPSGERWKQRCPYTFVFD